MKNTTQQPLKQKGLVQLIGVGNSIQHNRVKELQENYNISLTKTLILPINLYPENVGFLYLLHIIKCTLDYF